MVAVALDMVVDGVLAVLHGLGNRVAPLAVRTQPVLHGAALSDTRFNQRNVSAGVQAPGVCGSRGHGGIGLPDGKGEGHVIGGAVRPPGVLRVLQGDGDRLTSRVGAGIARDAVPHAFGQCVGLFAAGVGKGRGILLRFVNAPDKDGGRCGFLLTLCRQLVIILAGTAQRQAGDGDGLILSGVFIFKGAGGGDGQGVSLHLTVKVSIGADKFRVGIAVIGLILGGDAADGDGFGADGEVLLLRQTGIVVSCRHGEEGFVSPRVGGDGFPVGGTVRGVFHLHGAEAGCARGGAGSVAVSPAGDGGGNSPLVGSLCNLEGGRSAVLIPLVVVCIRQG